MTVEDDEEDDGVGDEEDDDDKDEDDDDGDGLTPTLVNHGFEEDEDDDNSGDERTGLHQLSRMGDAVRLRHLLEHPSERARVNELDENGMAAIHYAARYNHRAALQTLLQHGHALPGLRDESGATPLHFNARRQLRDGQDEQETTELIHILVKVTDVNAANNYGSTPLHLAAMRGNTPALTTILSTPGLHLEARDHNGSTALHEAVFYNQLEVVKLLLAAGADVKVKDRHGRLPLHKAAMAENNAKIVKVLQDAADRHKLSLYVNGVDIDKNTPLHLAVDSRNKPAVRALLKRGANVNAICRPSSTSSSPLHLAAVAGDARLMETLLCGGARVMTRDARRATPLHLAVEYQNQKAVNLLLAKSGRRLLETRDADHRTALIISAAYPNPRIVRALLVAGSDVMATDRRERTALHMAAQKNHLNLVQTLLTHVSEPGPGQRKAAFVNAVDQDHQTALHFAAKHGHTDLALALFENGADTSIKNADEDTPFLLAAKYGRSEVVDIFLEKTNGRMLIDTDEYLNTALHLAAAGGHLAIVCSLLEAGATKEPWNDKNLTPMDLAASKGHVSIVEYFIKENVPPNPVDKCKIPPLLMAAKNGHDHVVGLLLENGADVRAVDFYQRNCMDLAIANNHRDVLLAIVNSSRWRLALLHARDGALGKRSTPLRVLITKYPDIAQVVLNKCIRQSPEEVKTWDKDFWLQMDYLFWDDTYFDYSLATLRKMERTNRNDAPEKYDAHRLYGSGDPYTTDKIWAMENHPLTIIINKKRDELLSHPLVLSLARRKWNVVRPLYLLYLLYYIMFVAFVTALMLEATAPSQIDAAACEMQNATSVKTAVGELCTTMTMVLSIIGCITEVMQLVCEGWLYADPGNLLDWFSYISAIAVSTDVSPCGARTSWQWELGAFTLFSAWINMLLLVRRLPVLGLYVVMVTEILWTFGKVFMAFFLFIVAFGFSFYVLLENKEAFSTPSLAIIKTWVMMMGEMDYEDLFFAEGEERVHYPEVTFAIFLVFLVVLSIVLTNLLVGLAVDDVGELQRHAKLSKVAIQIELALRMELSFPAVLRQYFAFSVCRKTVYPNQPVYPVIRHLTNFVDGPILRMDRIIASAKALETEPDKFQEMSERIGRLMRAGQDQMSVVMERLEKLEGMMEEILAQPQLGSRRRRVP